uniref:CRAL-TRIO domain-containing protein n=1 Tax=Pyramimonas obovata TaxID=1411642 RepID=A0A7S0WWE4_9CHLO
MKAVYIVNAPGYFSSAFKLIKKFLDPRTQKKIQVCKTKTLDTVLDLNIVPSNVGGLGSNSILSQPTGELSAAHVKQDHEQARYVRAEQNGNPIVGPNMFSIMLGEGTPVYAERTKADLEHHDEMMTKLDRLSIDSFDNNRSRNSSKKVSTEVSGMELSEERGEPGSQGGMGSSKGHSPNPTFKTEGVWKVYEGFDAQVVDALATIDRALERVQQLQRGSRRQSNISHTDGEVHTNGLTDHDRPKSSDYDRFNMAPPRSGGLFENPATIPELDEELHTSHAGPDRKSRKKGLFACCFSGSQ